MISIAALALVAVLAQPSADAAAVPAPQAPAQADADAAPEPESTPDWNAPPAGSKEDQLLWRELRQATNGATLAMGRLSQCSFRIAYGKYYQRLDAMLETGGDRDRTDAKALRDRLAAEAKAADAAVPAKPGVRRCQYVLRDLGVLMPIAGDREAKQQLPRTRREGRECIGSLVPLAEKLRARADALEAALAAIDARSPALPASPAPGEAVKEPAAAPGPAQPPATGGAEGR